MTAPGCSPPHAGVTDSPRRHQLSRATAGGGCRRSSRRRLRRRRAADRDRPPARGVDDIEDLGSAKTGDLHGSHRPRPGSHPDSPTVGGDAEAEGGTAHLRTSGPMAVATTETSFAAIWNAEDKDHGQAGANVSA